MSRKRRTAGELYAEYVTECLEGNSRVAVGVGRGLVTTRNLSPDYLPRRREGR